MEAEDRSVFDLKEVQPTNSVSYGNASDQVIDFYLPEKTTKPLVVLIHGGFWRSEYDRKHLSPLAKALADSGWPVALIEYRRIIGNPDATLQDVDSAMVKLSEDFGLTILLGHSAGGHLALLVGSKFEVKGVIALAPVTDLIISEEMDLDEGAVSDFLGAPAKLRPDLNPIELSPLRTKVRVIHGSGDIRVPIQFSREYVSKMDTDSTNLLELENTGHFELIDPRSDVFSQICRELMALS
jgi:acetyl esterase/lipase